MLFLINFEKFARIDKEECIYDMDDQYIENHTMVPNGYKLVEHYSDQHNWMTDWFKA